MSPAPSRTLLDLLGVPIEIEVRDAALAARIAVCYGAGPQQPGEPAPGAPASAPVLRAQITGDAERACIRVGGRPPAEAHGPVPAVRTFNHELMHGVMLRRQDLFFVHAGVVAFGDNAVVLPGRSQAGKSTLVLALLAQGGRYLSDELLAFDPAGGSILPFPRAPKVRDVCVAYFPGYRDAFVGDGEGRFLPHNALGGGAPRPARPRWLVVPAYDAAGEDILEARSPGTCCLDLAVSALNFGGHRGGSLDPLAALVAAGPCYGLRWRDPHRAARAIAELVEARA